MANKYRVLDLPLDFTTYEDSGLDPRVLSALSDLNIRTKRNIDAIARAIQEVQVYENATGAPMNTLLSGVVADERLGAQVAGFKRGSVAYDLYGNQRSIHLPRYPYTYVPYPVWQDDFSVDQLSNQYTSGGDAPATWAVSGGVLTGTGGTQGTLIKKDLLLQNSDIVINSDQVDNGGIVARYQDSNNYYLLNLSDDSGIAPAQNLTLYKRVAGAFTSLGTANVTWVRGVSKPIKFTLYGSRLEAYFDGVKVISITDTAFSGGGVGLRNSSATASRYLDFKVYQAVQGAMSEEACTNIVPTWPTGWTVSGDVGMAAVDQGVQPGAALNTVRLTNSGATEGTYSSPLLALSPSTKYTVRIKARGTVATPKLDIYVLSNTGTLIQLQQLSIGLTGAFQVFSYTFTTSADITGTDQWLRFDHNGSDAGYIEIAEVTLIQKAYALTFPGYGATRAAEVLTLPMAGVFAKDDWDAELTFTPTSAQNVVSNILWRCYIDANNYYELGTNTSGYLYLTVKSGGTAVTITDNAALTVDTPYRIMASGKNSYMHLAKNDAEIGSGTAYTEPAGTLPALMYLGCDQGGANQANGIISDLRFGTAQTVQQHLTDYFTGRPLPVIETTTLKMDFANTLRQTARSDRSYKDDPITADKLVTVIDDRDPDIIYTPSPTPPGVDSTPTGPWYQWYGSMWYYNKTYTLGDGALAQTQSLEYTFTGSSISIIGAVTADCGKIDIYVNNIFEATVDTYAPFTGSSSWSLGRAELYKVENLPYATHTIKIVVRTDKNASSTGYKFRFDGFRIGQGLSVKALDILFAYQWVTITTNANGYGTFNIGGNEPGGNTGDYLILCITGASLRTPNPDSTLANKPKLGVVGQWIDVWDGPASSTVDVYYSVLLMPK